MRMRNNTVNVRTSHLQILIEIRNSDLHAGWTIAECSTRDIAAYGELL
jgi:hypothetical protein